MSGKYTTWDSARTTADKLEKIEGEIKRLREYEAHTADYLQRIRVEIGEKQNEFDQLAELRMKHQ